MYLGPEFRRAKRAEKGKTGSSLVLLSKMHEIGARNAPRKNWGYFWNLANFDVDFETRLVRGKFCAKRLGVQYPNSPLRGVEVTGNSAPLLACWFACLFHLCIRRACR